MSIVLKTKLKKIPDTCTKCRYSFFINYHRVCSATPHKESFKDCEKKYVLEKRNFVYVRPKWCPLTEMEENPDA